MRAIGPNELSGLVRVQRCIGASESDIDDLVSPGLSVNDEGVTTTLKPANPSSMPCTSPCPADVGHLARDSLHAGQMPIAIDATFRLLGSSE
jgi:hypothetical protein